MPADEVRREALKVEPPVVAVVCSADLAGDRARGEAGFDHAIRADQALPGKRIDLQRVPHVGVQQLEDWVHCAHSPLRCQDEWLHNSMCPQPERICQVSIRGFMLLGIACSVICNVLKCVFTTITANSGIHTSGLQADERRRHWS